MTHNSAANYMCHDIWWWWCGILFYRTKSIVHSELRLFSFNPKSVFTFILEYVSRIGQLKEKI